MDEIDDILELHDHPPLSSPVLIVALEGWIDAGVAASGAMAALLDSLDVAPYGSFETDELLDHRARRPTMPLVDGLVTELAWPAIEIGAAVDALGNHILLLHGAEPDHGWGRFCEAVTDLALDLDVRMIVGLGAYPAPTPHTRGCQLALTSPSLRLVETHTGFVRGTVDVPAGIQAALEMAAHEEGLEALSLWAQIPHYLSGMSYPLGSIALLDGIERVTGLTLPSNSLTEEASATRARIDQLVDGNSQHEEMVRQLEEAVDSLPATSEIGSLPTGEELAAEFQEFLREQGNS